MRVTAEKPEQDTNMPEKISVWLLWSGCSV